MNRTVMIVLLVICVIVLVVAIIAIIPRIKNALVRMPVFVYILTILVLLVLATILAINLFGPRGADSLFSEKVDGVEQGDASSDTDITGKEEGTGSRYSVEEFLAGNEIGDDTIYVSVRGDGYKIGQTEIEDVDDFTEALTALSGSDNAFCLVDDYATSRAYENAKALMDELGIEYIERTKE